MKAKKVYEFQQGQDPYKIMGLGMFKIGDWIRSKTDLNFDFDEPRFVESFDGFKSDIRKSTIYSVEKTNISFDEWFGVDIEKKHGSLGPGIGIIDTIRTKSDIDNSKRWVTNKQAKELFLNYRDEIS
jgi:hypothetical protein